MDPETRPSRDSEVPTEPPAGGAAEDLEKAQAILDVVQHATRYSRAVALATPISSYRSRPVVLGVIAISSVLLCLFTFIGRPEWVFGADPARYSPARSEAHLRFAMYLVAQRLDAHQKANRGELPQSLLAVGEDWPGFGYEIVDGSVFELRATAGAASPITLRSDEDLGAFLGSSARYLREQRP